MATEAIPGIGKFGGLEELPRRIESFSPKEGRAFSDSLKEAILKVDQLEHQSEAAQMSFAKGQDVELHDVLIKIEEAEVAFRAMMAVRSKLLEAYREVQRIGAGG